jgi:nucleoid-associated protein YgaU
VEKRVQAAADREKIALELANQAKVVVEVTKAQEATLPELEVATAERECRLAAREAEEVARLEELQEWEAAVEKELAARTRRLQECEAALQKREAKVEEFLAEWSVSIDRVVRWVGEVNPTLDALGLSPIRVMETPSSLGTVLPALDSTAEQLRHMEATIFDLLEIEGWAIVRGMAEYILTYLQSHDLSCLLTPILVGPLPAMAAAAQESVQEAADMVANRVQRRPGPTKGEASFGPPAE